MSNDSEHGFAIIAHNEDEARKFLLNAKSSIKAITIAEAKGTTKLYKDKLQEIYNKQIKG